MAYLIRNRQTGKYVAPPGQERSYTTREKARRFERYVDAFNNACSNETVVEE